MCIATSSSFVDSSVALASVMSTDSNNNDNMKKRSSDDVLLDEPPCAKKRRTLPPVDEQSETPPNKDSSDSKENTPAATRNSSAFVEPENNNSCTHSDRLTGKKRIFEEADMYTEEEMVSVFGDHLQRKEKRFQSMFKLNPPVPFPRSVEEKYHDDKKLAHAHAVEARQFFGKVHVNPLGTYQGRMVGSSNGCAIIATLVASKHAASGFANDKDVENIIDNTSIPVAKDIRVKTGETGFGFVSLTDVHEHCADEKLVQHDNDFVTAAGGNVLDKDHVASFLNALAVGDNNDLEDVPTAAAFMNQSHAICVTKHVNKSHGMTSTWYELIDSLPMFENHAVRIQCRDLDTLGTVLKWYTTRHMNYSDSVSKYEALESDKRSFFALVWCAKNKI